MLDFKTEARISMERAFLRNFQSALVSVTLTRPATDSTLDPVTEIVTGGTDGVNTVFKALLRNYKERVVDGVDIVTTDRKLTVPQSYITDTPKPNDHITIGTDVYRVVKAIPDAANVFYSIQIRKPS